MKPVTKIFGDVRMELELLKALQEGLAKQMEISDRF